MKNDALHEGQQAYLDIKRDLVRGQRGLCAFCEIEVTESLDDAAMDASRSRQRVEHFHPKSDRGGAVNWTLVWDNLYAVCHGGEAEPPEGMRHDSRHYMPPRLENLSCDAHKNHQVEAGRLAADPAGWILSPGEVPAFPRLFAFGPDGAPEADAGCCDQFVILGNRHGDTASLVEATIHHLNLGCKRLNRNRMLVKAAIEKFNKQQRERAAGVRAEEVRQALARRFLSSDAQRPLSAFFTFIRWRLGPIAETYLQETSYDG